MWKVKQSLSRENYSKHFYYPGRVFKVYTCIVFNYHGIIKLVNSFHLHFLQDVYNIFASHFDIFHHLFFSAEPKRQEQESAVWTLFTFLQPVDIFVRWMDALLVLLCSTFSLYYSPVPCESLYKAWWDDVDDDALSTNNNVIIIMYIYLH